MLFKQDTWAAGYGCRWRATCAGKEQERERRRWRARDLECCGGAEVRDRWPDGCSVLAKTS